MSIMKILAVLMIIVLLILPACGTTTSITVPTTTNQPSVQWQTYSDATYGYSINHPANWTVKTLGKENQGFRMISPDEELTVLVLADKSGDISADAVIDASLQTVNSIVEEGDGCMWAELLSQNAITCSGLPAREITFLIGEEHEPVDWHRTISVGKDNCAYSVAASCQHYLYEPNKEVLEEIINSFKLV
jgi:hypothetical protein